MVTARMSRVVVALASPLFAGAALAIWAAPEQAVQRLGLETVRATGLSVVRADIGGLFAGMSILCAAAAWTRRRPWIVAALAVLVSIVVGRCVGWISNRGIGSDVLEFAVEVGLIAALVGAARGSPPAAARCRRASQDGDCGGCGADLDCGGWSRNDESGPGAADLRPHASVLPPRASNMPADPPTTDSITLSVSS